MSDVGRPAARAAGNDGQARQTRSPIRGYGTQVLDVRVIVSRDRFALAERSCQACGRASSLTLTSTFPVQELCFQHGKIQGAGRPRRCALLSLCASVHRIPCAPPSRSPSSRLPMGGAAPQEE